MRLVARNCTWIMGLALLIPAANADTITTFPFTGTSSQFSVVVHLNISGDDFRYSLNTTEGPFVVAVCPAPGTACAFQTSYAAGFLPPPERVSTTAILDGLESHATTGRLSFSGTVMTPETGDFTATVPVSFTANINAFGASPMFPPLFSVALTGTGSADLSGFVQDVNHAIINRASYTFSGTATATVPSGPEQPIPEPASMFLTAGGIGMVGLLLRRRGAAS